MKTEVVHQLQLYHSSLASGNQHSSVKRTQVVWDGCGSLRPPVKDAGGWILVSQTNLKDVWTPAQAKRGGQGPALVLLDPQCIHTHMYSCLPSTSVQSLLPQEQAVVSATFWIRSLTARAALRELSTSLSRNSGGLGAELVWRAGH